MHGVGAPPVVAGRRRRPSCGAVPAAVAALACRAALDGRPRSRPVPAAVVATSRPPRHRRRCRRRTAGRPAAGSRVQAGRIVARRRRGGGDRLDVAVRALLPGASAGGGATPCARPSRCCRWSAAGIRRSSSTPSRCGPRWRRSLGEAVAALAEVGRGGAAGRCPGAADGGVARCPLLAERSTRRGSPRRARGPAARTLAAVLGALQLLGAGRRPTRRRRCRPRPGARPRYLASAPPPVGRGAVAGGALARRDRALVGGRRGAGTAVAHCRCGRPPAAARPVAWRASSSTATRVRPPGGVGTHRRVAGAAAQPAHPRRRAARAATSSPSSAPRSGTTPSAEPQRARGRAAGRVRPVGRRRARRSPGSTATAGSAGRPVVTYRAAVERGRRRRRLVRRARRRRAAVSVGCRHTAGRHGTRCRGGVRDRRRLAPPRGVIASSAFAAAHRSPERPRGRRARRATVSTRTQHRDSPGRDGDDMADGQDRSIGSRTGSAPPSRRWRVPARHVLAVDQRGAGRPRGAARAVGAARRARGSGGRRPPSPR